MTAPRSASFAAEFRRRLVPQLVFFVAIWPLIAILLGAAIIREQPITEALPLWTAILGTAAGALQMLPQLLVLGVLASLAGALVFAITSAALRMQSRAAQRWLEPVAMLLAVMAGLAIEYPALLRHPLLAPLRALRVMDALMVLIVVAVLVGIAGAWRRGSTGVHAGLTVAHGAVGVGVFALLAWGIAVAPRGEARKTAPRDSVFLVALDSLAQEDPVGPLRQMVARANGVWFENPVTPGLVTNAVWTSIFQHRPVHETGVFLTLQRPDWRRSPYHLVREAKRRKFETWSFFSDQFTCYLGSIGEFDVDRSGPKGWLQLATATMKDAHVLSPALLPRLPGVPFARTPRNQSGTFAFSLEQELHDIFSAGSRDARIFSAAHVDYLHQPAYPSMSQLTGEERVRVRRARVGAILDLSLHWQYPEVEGEPIGIYAWKIARLQSAIATAIQQTGVADPRKRNRIVIFSDHGNRKHAGLRDFARRRYYKVLFATIGIPAQNPRVPISLLDIPNLLGWPDPSRPGPADLAIEYTNVANEREFDLMMRTSKLAADGEIRLHPRVTTALGRRLLAYRPHSGSQAYIPVPAVPTEVTLNGAE